MEDKTEMNIKQFIKNIFKSFRSNLKLSIYSIVLSLVVWFFVSITVYPTTEETYNIPVETSVSGTTAESFGLNIVRQDIETVTVQIRGNRAVIGSLKATDLVAKAVTENISTAGNYQLSLNISSITGKSFDVVSVRPSSVMVYLDKYIEKSFPIEAEAPNVKAADGFIIGTPVASPNTINIRGPEGQVNKITRCVIRSEYGAKEEPLKESYEVTTGNQLLLYNENTVLETQNFNISQVNYSISLPIYMKKVLNLKLEFTNVPAGFPIDELKYDMDVSTIEVAAPNGNIENVVDFTIGYVDLRNLDIGSAMQFPINLPAGYQNLSSIQLVNVNFDGTGLAKKQINIKNKNVSIINGPSNLDFEPMTAGWNVIFIGDEKIIKELTAQDVVAQVNLLGENIKSGDGLPFPISFLVPNKGLVWAYDDSYSVVIRAKDKPVP